MTLILLHLPSGLLAFFTPRLCLFECLPDTAFSAGPQSHVMLRTDLHPISPSSSGCLLLCQRVPGTSRHSTSSTPSLPSCSLPPLPHSSSSLSSWVQRYLRQGTHKLTSCHPSSSSTHSSSPDKCRSSPAGWLIGASAQVVTASLLWSPDCCN